MPKQSDAESAVIQAFIRQYFAAAYTPEPINEKEESVVRKILEYVSSRFKGMTYILGLALDFTLLAQRLSNLDSHAKEFRNGFTIEQLFDHYPRVTQRGSRQANTLTLQFGKSTLGIRSIEEAVSGLFHQLNRSGYPSAYVYNTGQWQKYQDLLVLCFQLSESGRFIVCQELIDYGLHNLKENAVPGREILRVRLFPEIIAGYPRAAPGENGGLTFQAIAYGFVQADRPHLSLAAASVRTGSARVRRFGDIDCYFGLDLEMSVEVKDMHISSDNRDHQLGGFVATIGPSTILGLAFVTSIEEETRRELADAGVETVTLGEVLKIVRIWDWRKQDTAVHGMLHFLAHIEQNARAVNRLLTFIASKDEDHDSLAYYTPSASKQPLI